MMDLNGYFGAMPMNRLNQLFHAGNKLIIADTKLIGESLSARMNVGRLDDD